MARQIGGKNTTLEMFGFSNRPELRKICTYILRTDCRCERKAMYSDDLKTLFLLSQEDTVAGIVLSYAYGQAKGFRTCQQIERDERIGVHLQD